MKRLRRWNSAPFLHLARTARGICAGLALGCFAACSTFHPRPASHEELAALISQVQPGDLVECEMKNGLTREFTVVAVSAGWLIGRGTSAYAGDIVKLKLTKGAIQRADDATWAALLLWTFVHHRW